MKMLMTGQVLVSSFIPKRDKWLCFILLALSKVKIKKEERGDKCKNENVYREKATVPELKVKTTSF